MKKRQFFFLYDRSYFSSVQIFFSFNLIFPLNQQKQVYTMIETQKSSTALQQVTSSDISTICSKCGEKILNVMTADENKVYHPHCFNCSDCSKTLAGGFFYKSKNIKSDQLQTTAISRNSLNEPVRFCETCYKKIAPKWYVNFNRNKKGKELYDLVHDVRILLKHHRLFGKRKNFMNHALLVVGLIKMVFNVERLD